MGKKWELLQDVGAAFANMIRILATPPTKRADQIAAEEFCAKMRGIGANPEQGLMHAARIAAIGASDEQIAAMCRILAQGCITTQDARQLRWRGIEVDAEVQP